MAGATATYLNRGIVLPARVTYRRDPDNSTTDWLINWRPAERSAGDISFRLPGNRDAEATRQRAHSLFVFAG
jgi:hypothetical protein